MSGKALCVGIRLGYGQRHPDLSALLIASRPTQVRRLAWLHGEMPLGVGAHLGSGQPPDDLVASIRCIVRVGERIVVCETPDGIHPRPGGRREPGESHRDTARREVHEETGWLLEPLPFEALGWLHLHHLRDQPEDHPYPHPDFIQVVYAAKAIQRDGEIDATWSDTEGWETGSELPSPTEARARVSPGMLAHVFLDTLFPADRASASSPD